MVLRVWRNSNWGQAADLERMLIHLPKDKYKQIVAGQTVIYETDIAPKKK